MKIWLFCCAGRVFLHSFQAVWSISHSINYVEILLLTVLLLEFFERDRAFFVENSNRELSLSNKQLSRPLETPYTLIKLNSFYFSEQKSHTYPSGRHWTQADPPSYLSCTSLDFLSVQSCSPSERTRLTPTHGECAFSLTCSSA